MVSPRHAEASWLAVAETFCALCISVDTPRSLKAYLLVKDGQYSSLEQLLRMKIHASEYLSGDNFAVDYAIVSFLKKNADMPVNIDTCLPAIAAFENSEALCKMTNETIEAYLQGELCVRPAVSEVIHLAQRKIARLLSVQPSLDEGPYSWGPGATYDLNRLRAYPDTKLVELPFTVTGSAWKHAAKLINSDLHWKDAICRANPTYTGKIFTILPGGRFDTVPKTALVDRCILIEPRLNTILQKRIGIQIRGLLKRVGVDLDDQSRNQILAQNARALDLATLDLEAASDSISRKVVELLIPPAWFEIMDDLRSKWYQKKDGSWHRLEKFSSMGNGFTFELESLIFWALASASSELSFRGILGVYGDDIVLHRDAVPQLLESFAFLGFRLNAEKSFTDGEFFESCGKHYFGDTDVTPAYQKCSPVTGVEACRMGNRLLRLAARLGCHVSFDERIRGAWEQWRRRWNVDPSQYGPYLGEGDGYWESPYSQIASRTRSGPFGPWYRVASYYDIGREIPSDDAAMLALWLMQYAHHELDVAPKQKGPSETIRSLVDLPDALVTITGTSRKRKISSSNAEIGMIDSRVKPRVGIRHGNILGCYSTYLDW